MKKYFLLTLLFFIFTTEANAAVDHLSLAYKSNYIFRGLTWTNDNAAVQATYEVAQSEKSGFYAGGFLSNVESGNNSGTQFNLFGGLRLGGDASFQFDLGAIQYMFTNSNVRESFHEFFAGISTDKYLGKIYWGEDNASYLELGARYNISGDLNVDLHYGRTSGRGNEGNDIAASLVLDMDKLLVAGTMSYEDRSNRNESKAFLTVMVTFDI